MVLTAGSKVLIVHRRLFEGDHPRYFVGQVDGYENGIARVTGQTFVYDVVDGFFEKKKDRRTKIFSILSGNVFCYELPNEVKLDELIFEHQLHNVFLTDKNHFYMDLTENYRSPVRLRQMG